MEKQPDAVIHEIKQGTLAPVYFLFGDEPYYIDKITDLIEKIFVQSDATGMNANLIYGKDSTIINILPIARQFPMMAERQMVMIKEAQDLPDWDKADAKTQLQAYLKNPLPSTILVFAYKHSKWDERKDVAKALKSAAIYCKSEKVRDYKFPEWVRKYLLGRQIKISPIAEQLLIESVGADLTRFEREIDKILINIEDGKSIEKEHIEKFVGISREFNIFELQKSLAMRDVNKALQIAYYFSESQDKSNALIVQVASLYNYFTKVALTIFYAKESDEKIGAEIKVHPFLVKEYRQAARTFSLMRIYEIIAQLREVDARLKGQGPPIESEWEMWKELIVYMLA